MKNNVFVIGISDSLKDYLTQHNLRMFLDSKDKKGYYTELKYFLESVLNYNTLCLSEGYEIDTESYITYVTDVMNMPDYLDYNDIIRFVKVVFDITVQIINSVGLHRIYEMKRCEIKDITEKYVVFEDANYEWNRYW